MATLRAAVRVESGVDGVGGVHWLGTSMGGIIGMLLAAQPHTPVTRLVVNDVGSFIPKASLERIAMYVGKSPPFPSVEAAVDAVRATSPFGPLSDTEWRGVTPPPLKANEEGGWGFPTDPRGGEGLSRGRVPHGGFLRVW